MRVGSTLRWLADQVDPPKPHQSPPYPCRAKTVFTDVELEAQRREDAMSLLDEDTMGYLLVRVRDEGSFAKLGVQVALAEEMWPAVNETLARVILEAQRVHR